MGLAFLFVLTLSNIIISSIRKIVPNQIRIPVFITVIATVVTVADYLIAGFFPPLHKNLGVFLPLIVVNCIVLGRAEAFASHHSVFLSLLDAVGMGIGFTAIITFIGVIREILGNGTLWGKVVMPATYAPFLLFLFPPGAFLIMAFLLALHKRWS
jgi:electron transport complex protein RnfE